jgi:hypothetical protein
MKEFKNGVSQRKPGFKRLGISASPGLASANPLVLLSMLLTDMPL